FKPHDSGWSAYLIYKQIQTHKLGQSYVSPQRSPSQALPSLALAFIVWRRLTYAFVRLPVLICRTNVVKNTSKFNVGMDISNTDSVPTLKCDDEIYEFQMSNCSDELSSGYGSPSPLAVTQLERFST
ncbi:hypothetical protein AHF37_05470, partial [Paragonimus kellicotti]